ncbi:MAG TPA: hypothetical protein VFA60_09220 [Terriglobales bacterium]|nr:hypothetical protein [Terriglobales bacterium]
MKIVALDHVQIAAPPGCEAAARRFFGELLGLAELPKPEALRARGGCWFQCGAQQLHVGVERDFTPARKAHPAFRVSGLVALRERLLAANHAVSDDTSIPNTVRFFVNDPWGNRLEFFEERGR